MPDLSVSEFAAIAVTTGKPKIRKIIKVANKDAYVFYKDYYLGIRTAIKNLFIHKRHISHLDLVVKKQSPLSKKIKFGRIANNFRDWQSGKNIQAYTPPKQFFSHQQTMINCNPELHVLVNGKPKLVKLHFSESEKMTQERANFICHLMKEALEHDDYLFSVLDLTTGNEYYLNEKPEVMDRRVYKEIDIIEQNWQ